MSLPLFAFFLLFLLLFCKIVITIKKKNWGKPPPFPKQKKHKQKIYKRQKKARKQYLKLEKKNKNNKKMTTTKTKKPQHMKKLYVFCNTDQFYQIELCFMIFEVYVFSMLLQICFGTKNYSDYHFFQLVSVASGNLQ